MLPELILYYYYADYMQLNCLRIRYCSCRLYLSID
jgi:hypothetical protein